MAILQAGKQTRASSSSECEWSAVLLAVLQGHEAEQRRGQAGF
jgi:hypothetical protein